MIPCSLSDHSLVFCVFKAGACLKLVLGAGVCLKLPKSSPRTIEYRSYKHYNKPSFLQDLRDTNWTALLDERDTDATVNNLCQRFTDIADEHAPIKKMKVKGVNIPWMTAELSQAMQD